MFWSPQQDRALMAIRRWLRDPGVDLCFRLFGFAGTGKTEIAHATRMNVKGAVFAAFTGKAAHVLRQRGCDPVSTIHKLIYKHTRDPVSGFFIKTLKSRDDLSGVSLFVIDEASMIDAEVARDLLSFRIKTLVIADPEQLPPVKGGDGYFMHGEPDAILSEVHRQALDSPILRLATDIRQGKWMWKKGRYGDLVITDAVYSRDGGLNYDVILTGTHDTRHHWNRKVRIDWGFLRANEKQREPQRDETLICLHNDYSVDDEVFNGQLWNVHWSAADVVVTRAGVTIPVLRLALRNDEGRTEVRVRPRCFNGATVEAEWIRGLQDFDFGYAMTVHKSQGSEWDKVMLVNESRAFPGLSRAWLYTGITRASKQLTIIDP